MPVVKNRIEYVLTAVDNVTKTMKKVTDSVRDSEKEVRNMGIAMAAAGALTLKFQFENVKLAARVTELGIVMKKMGETAGIANSEILRQEEAIKKQGITTQASRQILVQMLQAQINVTNASKLARIAQDAAVIAQTNSSDAAEKVVFAIASGNFELLRSLGLYENLNVVYREFADEIGKTAGELTEAEKRTARLNSVFESGEKIVGVYEEAMGTAGKKMRSLERPIEELRLKLGKDLEPAFGVLVDVIGEFLKIVNDTPPVVIKMTTGVLAASAAAATAGGTFILFKTALSKLPPFVGRLTTKLGVLGVVMASVSLLAPLIAKGFENLLGITDEYTKLQDNANLSVQNSELALDATMKKAIEMGIAFGETVNGGGAGGDGVVANAEKMSDAIQDIATAYANINEEINTTLANLGIAHRKFVNDQRDSLDEAEDNLKNFNKKGVEEASKSADRIIDILVAADRKAAKAREKAGQATSGAERVRQLDIARKLEAELAIETDKLTVEQRKKMLAELNEVEQGQVSKDLRREEEREQVRLERITKEQERLEEKITDIKRVTDEEAIAFQSQRDQLVLTQTQMQNFHDTYTENLVDMNNVTEDMVGSMLEKLEEIQALIDKINSAQNSLLGLRSASASRGIGRVPGSATGGFVEGITLVGERGPELVSFPSGSKVTEAGETRRLLSQDSESKIIFSAPIIGSVIVNNEADEDRLAMKIKNELSRMIRLQQLRAT